MSQQTVVLDAQSVLFGSVQFVFEISIHALKHWTALGAEVDCGRFERKKPRW